MLISNLLLLISATHPFYNGDVKTSDGFSSAQITVVKYFWNSCFIIRISNCWFPSWNKTLKKHYARHWTAMIKILVWLFKCFFNCLSPAIYTELQGLASQSTANFWQDTVKINASNHIIHTRIGAITYCIVLGALSSIRLVIMSSRTCDNTSLMEIASESG